MDRRMLRELELLEVASLYALLPVPERTTENTVQNYACLVLGDVEAGTDAARLLEAMLASIGLQPGKDYKVTGSVDAGELAGVRLILALGPEAAGRARALEGPTVVRTHHPAELIAHPADKARAWEALLLARRTLQEAGSSSLA